jgi:hypothetical protein
MKIKLHSTVVSFTLRSPLPSSVVSVTFRRLAEPQGRSRSGSLQKNSAPAKNRMLVVQLIADNYNDQAITVI